MKRPMPTVLTMKRVLDRHLRPIGLDLAMFCSCKSEEEVGQSRVGGRMEGALGAYISFAVR